ncbi:MAG: hypothetical protein GY749_32120 [Desulfobacteraceae bacterium]|nr:hypothetical protein [Desulfobacteraceae bacterium]
MLRYLSAKSIEENSFTNLQDLITEVAAKDREIKSLVVAYPNGTVITTSDQKKYQQFSKIQNQYILQQLQKKEDWISKNKKDKLVEIVSFIYTRCSSFFNLTALSVALYCKRIWAVPPCETAHTVVSCGLPTA